MDRRYLRVAGGYWRNLETVASMPYNCGYCGCRVSSDRGWNHTSGGAVIFICPECGCPTISIPEEGLFPAELPGREVSSLPADVGALYDEARECIAGAAFTAAVLVCRKLLMHIAVAEGADPSEGFLSYVEFLSARSYVPPRGKQWVDYIRKRGNEANHEIELMSEAEAKGLLAFIEMLLRLVYEFPAMVPEEER